MNIFEYMTLPIYSRYLANKRALTSTSGASYTFSTFQYKGVNVAGGECNDWQGPTGFVNSDLNPPLDGIVFSSITAVFDRYSLTKVKKTARPTQAPSPTPSCVPSPGPTTAPTVRPTNPTTNPSPAPTHPTASPTPKPTKSKLSETFKGNISVPSNFSRTLYETDGEIVSSRQLQAVQQLSGVQAQQLSTGWWDRQGWLYFNGSVTCSDVAVVTGLVLALRDKSKYINKCGGVVWQAATCRQYSVLCINCGTKDICNTCPIDAYIVSPCAKCISPSVAYSMLRVDLKKNQLFPRLVYPGGLSVQSAANSSIVLAVTIRAAQPAGVLACAAFTETQSVASVYDVISAGIKVAIKATTANSTTVSYSISGLYADTVYSIYCYTEDLVGHVMDWNNTFSTKITARTSCCRAASFDLSGKKQPLQITPVFNQSVGDEFQVRLNAVPRAAISVRLSVAAGSSAGGQTGTCVARQGGEAVDRGSLPYINPPVFSFDPTSLSLSGAFVLKPAEKSQGCYIVRASVQGPDSFLSDFFWLTILPWSSFPPAPNLKDAVFSGDGLKIIVTFDRTTNRFQGRGNFAVTQEFSCSVLFQFDSSKSSICLWTSPQVVEISKSNVLPGRPLTIVANVLRVACTATSLLSCDEMPYSDPLNNRITIRRPDASVTFIPVLALSTARKVVSCSDIVIDSSGSIGQGGKPWLLVQWQVVAVSTLTVSPLTNSAFSAAANMTKLLNTNFQSTDDVITLPNRIIVPGVTYSITLTLTNFLGSSATSSVLVDFLTRDFIYTPIVRCALAHNFT